MARNAANSELIITPALARTINETDLERLVSEGIHEPVPLPIAINNPETDQFDLINQHILFMNTSVPTLPNAIPNASDPGLDLEENAPVRIVIAV